MRYRAFPRPIKTRGRSFIRPHQGQFRHPKKISESVSDTWSKHATNFLPYLAGAGSEIIKTVGPEIAKTATNYLADKATKYLNEKIKDKKVLDTLKLAGPEFSKVTRTASGYLGSQATNYLDRYKGKKGYSHGQNIGSFVGKKYLGV